MDISISIDDKAGVFAEAIGKFVADVKKATGPGAASAGVITAEILSAAVSDLIPAFADFSGVAAAISADKVKFGLAIAVALENALAL